MISDEIIPIKIKVKKCIIHSIFLSLFADKCAYGEILLHALQKKTKKVGIQVNEKKLSIVCVLYSMIKMISYILMKQF